MKAFRAAAAVLVCLPPLAAFGQGPSGGGLRPALSEGTASSGQRETFASAVSLIPDRDSLVTEVRETRLRLGPVRLKPRLSIGQFGYTNNFFGETDEERIGDFTATVQGGLRAIVPIGTSVFLRGGVLPSYVWYASHPERRAFGGTYDASALVYVSRFSFLLTGGSYSSTEHLSSEVEQPVEQRVLLGRLQGQWELGRRTALTGDLTLRRRRHGGAGFSDEDLAMLSKLDGSDVIWAVGVRRKVGSRLQIGASYEQGRLSFVRDGALRDARSRGVLGSAFLGEGRLELNAFAGYRKFDSRTGSAFVPYGGPSGGVRVHYAASRLFTIGVLGRSSLQSSLYANNAVFDERRVGASLGFSPRRVSLFVTYEVGENRYLAATELPDGSAVKRNDDVQTARGAIRTKLGRFLNLGVEASRSRYTSNLPGFDRTVFQIGTTVGIGATGSIDILR